MAVKGNYGSQREILRTKKGQPIHSFDSKNLQEDESDTGVVVHHSTVQHCMHKQGLSRRAIRGTLNQRTNHKC